MERASKWKRRHSFTPLPPMICIRVSHCIYADVAQAFADYTYRRLATSLMRISCTYRLDVRKRKRTVAWYDGLHVFMGMHGQIRGRAPPSLFIQRCTKRPFCLRKYHLLPGGWKRKREKKEKNIYIYILALIPADVHW